MRFYDLEPKPQPVDNRLLGLPVDDFKINDWGEIALV